MSREYGAGNTYTRQFTQRIDGEDYLVLFVDSSREGLGEEAEEVCEGCGQEVNVFMISDPDSSEEPVVAECLPCFFRGDFEKVEPR